MSGWGEISTNTFTIIAFPNPGTPKHLDTFAITEDQIVRIYDPDNGNKFESVKTWDPLL
jgi:hypothetical protein